MTTSAPRKKSTVLPDERVERMGVAAARLHRLLKELGHTRNLEKSASTMPDARDRLSFIDKSMHDASEKAINAVEAAVPLNKKNGAACKDMTARLSGVSFGKHQDLITDVISGLQEMAAAEKAINRNLTQIMEAQAFRDVAGQMVKKIVDAAIEVESILLEILKEYAPDTKDSLISTEGLTAGPGLKTQNNVNGQDEVDDLLASLGL